MTKKKSFFDQVWAVNTKTDKQLLKEEVKDRIEDFIVECKSQIAHIETGLLPAQKLEIARANRAIVKAKRKLTDVKLSVVNTNTFAEYASKINDSEKEVWVKEQNKDNAENKASILENQLAKFKEILAKLEE